MKYNDYIILTDEDYNNMKNKYNLLDELDKEKLLEIYNALTREYVVIEKASNAAFADYLSLTKKHIQSIKAMLSSSGVDVPKLESSAVEPKPTKPKYYNPLARMFMLNRPPRPMPPPFYPYPNELDLIDLIFMYLMLRPHCRFNYELCSIAHDRVGYLKKMK